MISTEKLIRLYNLKAHPEGGWYSENYRSEESIAAAALPQRFGGDRSFSTAIYFLLEHGNFSAFHRIKSDECWHFYAGDPLQVFIIGHDGELQIIHLGSNIEQGEVFQYVVPANCWFASRPAPHSSFCFVGCTVAPGFDFRDFELANAQELSNVYPRHQNIIRELCR